MARSVRLSDYPVLRKYEGTHEVRQVLKTSPPVFLAIKHEAVCWGTHTRGPLASFSSLDREKRFAATWEHIVPAIEYAWKEVGPEVRAKNLVCWATCCNERSPDWGKKRHAAALVLELDTTDGKNGWSTSSSDADCTVTVDLDFNADEDLTDFTLAGAFEGFAEWFDKHSRIEEPEAEPTDDTHQFFTVMDDFPVTLAILKATLQTQPQLNRKVTRAFLDSWAECSPADRSEVRSTWGAFWSSEKWGQQDPDPKITIVLTPNSEEGEYPSWDHQRKIIWVSEDFAVESAESSIMHGFSYVVAIQKSFTRLYAEPIPPPRVLPQVVLKRAALRITKETAAVRATPNRP